MEEQAIVALVTGANRGIGLEVARQLADLGIQVILGSRVLGKGEAVANALIGQNLKVVACQLDITDPESIKSCITFIESRFGRLNILVNNAAILYDSWQQATNADLKTVSEAFQTNTLGPWQMCQAVLPLLRRSQNGRIVNVSSEAGSLTSMGGGTPAYNVSKVALNALTRMLAAELASTGILVNSVCPGWVATDMRGAGGRPVVIEAAGIVWAATLPANGPNGGFFRDRKPLPW